MLERFLLAASVLLVLSVLLSKTSSRFGIPALVLFLFVGILAGTHPTDALSVINATVVKGLGTVALVFILFAGGMSTSKDSLRSIVRPALSLATLAVVIATVLTGLFAHLVSDFSFVEGCLLGAVVAATDVAAVFTVLRSKNVRLKSGLAPLLELESALNDPMAVFLGVALMGLLTQQVHNIFFFIPMFVQQMVFGGVGGWLFGKFSSWAVNFVRLEYDGLYPALVIGLVILCFTITQYVGGSGFLAVYVTGLIMGNRPLMHKQSLLRFHEGLSWLMQIAMFLAMGLLVDPKKLIEVAPLGVAITFFLLFVARPVSVFAALPTGRFSIQEKAMISWAGLRGSVPIILAMFLLSSQIPKSDVVFHLVFFVTFISVLIQGTTIPLLAKRLHVDSPFQDRPRFPIELNPTTNLKNSLIEIALPAHAKAVGKTVLQLNLPKDTLIVLIQRDGDTLVPRGSTQMMANDVLLIVTENRNSSDIQQWLI